MIRIRNLYRDRVLYLMLVPGVLFFLLFKYLPMGGLGIAFQEFMPFLGVFGSPWVGLQHFERLFSDPDFLMLFSNTFILALYNILFFFPLPIIVALMLNEIRHEGFKRSIQSIIYLPHFLSWVVIASISFTLLAPETGLVNLVLKALGGESANFLTSEAWFRPLITIQVIWKEVGWGTILFLAALANVDTELYDAAAIDGANRWQRMWHITLPALKPVIITLLILRMGSFLDSGFEQIYLMQNSLNRGVSEVFDTYVYSTGLIGGQFSYSAAVGFFKSIVALLLVLAANKLAKKVGEEGVY